MEESKLYAWLLEGGKNLFYECYTSFEIYLLARHELLLYIKDLLTEQGKQAWFAKRRTFKGRRQVLCVSLKPNELRRVVNQINRVCNYSCEIFNSDIPMEEYYLFKHDVFPTGKVRLDIRNSKIVSMSTKESPFDDYDLPQLRVAYLELETDKPLRQTMEAKLKTIKMNGIVYKGSRLIESFAEGFTALDPDVIITEDGELELPYLLRLIRSLYPKFSFSRFGRDELVAGGHSYFTYGRVIYKHNAVHLKGRLHLRKRGTLYGAWSLWYPFELARVCYLTLQSANARSIGYCCSNRQLYFAMKHGFLIPRTSSYVERWKSGLELFNADRGPLVFEPQQGYHSDIAEIDFVSLFPSIMVRENISAETLFCKCCPQNRVPGLNINICRRERGVMADVLEPLIEQREHYKKRHKHRADILKGLLVTSFGYMGYRKSRLARIEAHQAIQAYAREILLRAAKIAERHGFEVLHGIVDSLWVKRKGLTRQAVHTLIDEIEASLGYRAKLEGIYRWVVFLPSSLHPHLPVATHYYGVFDTGEVKCRGIELRKHNTPGIVKALQARVIRCLSACQDYKGFLRAMRESEDILSSTLNRINLGYVSQEDLLITKGIAREKYRHRSPQAVVMQKLTQSGYSPKPGDYVRYVITHRGSSIPGGRYALAAKGDNFHYDKREYSKLVRRAFENLFIPFRRQLTIYQALHNDNSRVKAKELPVQVKEGIV